LVKFNHFSKLHCLIYRTLTHLHWIGVFCQQSDQLIKACPIGWSSYTSFVSLCVYFFPLLKDQYLNMHSLGFFEARMLVFSYLYFSHWQTSVCVNMPYLLFGYLLAIFQNFISGSYSITQMEMKDC